jgi:tRNA1Val (adenine37-N6)-methyltransferase
MMSSINSFPTFKYSQPEAYHFSHDSVFLAREVFEQNKSDMKQPGYMVLDLCAGCGIVGMDLLFHQLKESTFNGEVDFLEIQSIYQSHFDENKQSLFNCFPDQNLKLNWIQKNYAEINDHKKYDLILSNPPYFLKGNGMLSDNEFKNRCRFFLDSGWLEMLMFMQNSLKENGKAYFLVRNELKKIIEKEAYFNTSLPKVRFLSQIRGTWIASIFNSI